MLNKELLLATESKIAGHIKLTVGERSDTFGYFEALAGSINRIPTWNKGNDPIKMLSILTNPEEHNTIMDFYRQVRVNADSITMTVVEKKLTVVLNWHSRYGYHTMTEVFDPSDQGKTFTIVFDPEPTGYA